MYRRSVDYINGKGSFLDPHTLKAVMKNGKEVRGVNILLVGGGSYVKRYKVFSVGSC